MQYIFHTKYSTTVVVHVFSKKAREYYEFERLWADGKITHVKDE